MPVLSSTSKEGLIRIAREALEHFVKTGEVSCLRPEDPVLWEHWPCFVTLRKRGQLRGCVGTLRTEKPLHEELVKMTAAAASEDFRFKPLTPEELKDITIEISVVSPLERIHSPSEIEVGRHGVYIKWRDQSGAFLPEVGQEMGWTAEELVRSCFQEKAQLPLEAWTEAELYRFTTEKIKENA